MVLVAAINVNLKNNMQVTYTGRLYVGSQQVSNDVVFDTGSGWLTIGTTDCDKCTLPKYSPQTSQSSALLSSELKSLSVRDS